MLGAGGMTQMTCIDLVLGYERKTVVSGLSFTVGEGDYLCVAGENGSGKSTLMKAMLKINAPISGRIEIGGGLTHDEIGYLPQQTAAQKDFPASVREIVRTGCLNRRGLRPFYTKAEKRIAEENMERLGVAHLAGCCYRELSGGQQQRALIARALCAARKLLLLDEPAAGLDPKAAEELYELLARLNHSGITLVIVSHDMAASIKYATHILHIGARSPLFFGTKAEYLKSGPGCSCAEAEGRIL